MHLRQFHGHPEQQHHRGRQRNQYTGLRRSGGRARRGSTVPSDRSVVLVSSAARSPKTHKKDACTVRRRGLPLARGCVLWRCIMKAIVVHEYGGPEVLKFEEFPDPVPGPGEVLVRVAAASVNPIDYKRRAGLTKDFYPIKFPGLTGIDMAGTVVKIGSGVEDFSVGDQVFAMTDYAYAELCVVKAALLAKIPKGLDLIEAAALPLVTVTGNQLLSATESKRAKRLWS